MIHDMRAVFAAVTTAGLLAAAGACGAQTPPGPQSPPPPWFLVTDAASRDPSIADVRLLWNREARTLRYCRKDAATGDFACADTPLPDGRWVLQRIQSQPEDGVDLSARFYSPDLDRTLECQAAQSGAFDCE